jgi:hypothetical protein
MAAETDTRQSLPPEPVRHEALEVVKLPELGGRVSGAQQREIGAIDTVAVIGDLDELEASFLQGELDGGRTGVERVFNELLDRVGWAMYDLLRETNVGGNATHLRGSNLVHNILR